MKKNEFTTILAAASLGLCMLLGAVFGLRDGAAPSACGGVLAQSVATHQE